MLTGSQGTAPAENQCTKEALLIMLLAVGRLVAASSQSNLFDLKKRDWHRFCCVRLSQFAAIAAVKSSNGDSQFWAQAVTSIFVDTAGGAFEPLPEGLSEFCWEPLLLLRNPRKEGKGGLQFLACPVFPDPVFYCSRTPELSHCLALVLSQVLFFSPHLYQVCSKVLSHCLIRFPKN